jgi:hypothetical protein
LLLHVTACFRLINNSTHWNNGLSRTLLQMLTTGNLYEPMLVP